MNMSRARLNFGQIILVLVVLRNIMVLHLNLVGAVTLPQKPCKLTNLPGEFVQLELEQHIILFYVDFL